MLFDLESCTKEASPDFKASMQHFETSQQVRREVADKFEKIEDQSSHLGSQSDSLRTEH